MNKNNRMSGALTTSGLSHRHREPAYYIGDCRISIHSNIELQTRARPYRISSNKTRGYYFFEVLSTAGIIRMRALFEGWYYY